MDKQTIYIQKRVFVVNNIRVRIKELEAEKKKINGQIKQKRVQIEAIELELKELTNGNYGKPEGK